MPKNTRIDILYTLYMGKPNLKIKWQTKKAYEGTFVKVRRGIGENHLTGDKKKKKRSL